MISNRLAVCLAALMLCTGSALAAAADEAPVQVKVSFDHPEKFVDADDRGFGGGPSKTVRSMLESEFQKLGKQYLAADQSLEVTITDVDLAGQFEPSKGPNNTDLRIVRASGWPRIDFRYVLKKGDVEQGQGKESLKDLNFQQRQLGRYSSQSFGYERRLLEDWFRLKFAVKN